MISGSALFRRVVAYILSVVLLTTPLVSYAAPGGGGGGSTTCNFTGAVSSAWSVAGNWNCGYVPRIVDRVIIPNGQSVESDAFGAVGVLLQIDSGGSLTVSGGTLEIGSTFTNAGLFTSTGGTTTISSTITNSGIMAMNGGTFSSSYEPTGTLINNGTINGSGTGTILEVRNLFNNLTGVINHTGGWQIRVDNGGFYNSGTYNSTADDSIFRFTTSGSAVPTTVTYPNLEFGGSISPPDNSRFVAYGNITLLENLNFTANSSTFVLPGNWTTETHTVISSNHTTVEFTGSATSTLTVNPDEGANFFDIKVNKDVVDKGVQLLSNATATHALVLTQGLFDYNGYTLTLPESCTFIGGTTAWETPSNWDCAGVPRLPNITDTVTIPSGQSPVMSAIGSEIGSFAIEASAALEVRADAWLNIYGTSTNDGTIIINAVGGAAGGNVYLAGDRYSTSTNSGLIQATDGASFNAYAPLVNLGTIDVSASGRLTLGQNMDTVGDLNVSGLGELILSGSGDTTEPAVRFVPAVSPIGTLRISLNNPGERIALEANVTTTYALNLDDGDLNLNGHTLSLDGTANLTIGAMGGWFGSGTLEFTGSGDQTIGTATYTTISSMRIRKTSGRVSQGASAVNVNDAFEVVSGTYLVDGGVLNAMGSYAVGAMGTVSSTVSSSGNWFTGFTNAGTMYIDGTATVIGEAVNNGTIYLGSSLSMTVDTLTNNNSIIGDADGGTLTVSTAFTKGDGSTFSAPLNVTFLGPADMPAYSYNNVLIKYDVTLSTDADTLTFGEVVLDPGAPGPTWTIQNTGSAQSDVNIGFDSLYIQSGATVAFSGTSVGPTVTTTGVLTNNGTLTLNNTSLSLAGLALDGMGAPTTALTGSGAYVFTNSDLRIFGSVPETIPVAVYQDLSLLGSGTYTLSASTTVMATTTITSGATLDLSTYQLSAIGDIANSGLITSSTGAVLHHPVDYVRFSDSSGTLVTSLTDGDSLYMTLKDQSRNLDGGLVETMVITATSTAPAGSDSESLTLTETSASSGIFRNTSVIPVGSVTIAATENGTFELIGDGIGNATYVDAFDASDSSSTSVLLAYTQPVSEPEPESTPAPTVNRGGGAASSGGNVAPIALVWNTPSQLISAPIIPPVTQLSAEVPVPRMPSSTLEEFLRSGTTLATKALGSGERLALLKDARETMGRTDIPVEDLERMAEGKIPKTRNLTIERALVPRALATFQAMFNHAPNFKIDSENLAWNTLMYRIRFPRDLKQESQGIQEFKRTFKKNPSNPFQWSVVRVMGYMK